uniref:Uncharacterized protein n=1 Tax=Arundo donax TaxID=35708 RepID=A0A0A9PYQ1_ARUDO
MDVACASATSADCCSPVGDCFFTSAPTASSASTTHPRTRVDDDDR